MAISPKGFSALLFAFLASLTLMGCKPETPPQRSSQTGAFVSPRATATPPTSPLPTPLVTSGPSFTPSPAPQLTPILLIGPQLLDDPISHFSLMLSPGWHSSVPDSHFASVTTVANYNFHAGSRPTDGISIQIQAGPLPASQSFEQWSANFRAGETSPENGAFGVTLTTPQPYKLGQYEGIEYIATGQEGENVLVLLIPSGDGWVAVISISPADASDPPSPAFSEALTMLSTIQISSKPLQ